MQDNALLNNLDKIHTTELGERRITKNLELKTNNLMNWCKRKIKQADKIVRKGKNWYVNSGDSILTINANNYSVITAHKVK